MSTPPPPESTRPPLGGPGGAGASVPARLAGFDLQRKLGAGGMATVYLGRQQSLDRPVVLKLLHPHLAEDPDLVARFEREARSAAGLRHENIVQIIEFGRDGAVSFIAMEFVDGTDVKSLLELHGPPPLPVGLVLLREVARGMAHAHAHGVIHRDIKPANLMLTANGLVKIMDFGLARRDSDSVVMTTTGQVMGTPAYMSPEQARAQAVDARSDLFSLGVVGYELLSGRRPFPGTTWSEVFEALTRSEPIPLGDVAPAVPERVRRLIAALLVRDPAGRPQSADRVVDELGAALDELDVRRERDLLREYAAEMRILPSGTSAPAVPAPETVVHGAGGTPAPAPASVAAATPPPSAATPAPTPPPGAGRAPTTPPAAASVPPAVVTAPPDASPALPARGRSRLLAGAAAGLLLLVAGGVFLVPRLAPPPLDTAGPATTDPGTDPGTGTATATAEPVRGESPTGESTATAEPPRSSTGGTSATAAPPRSSTGGTTATAEPPRSSTGGASTTAEPPKPPAGAPRRYQVSMKPSFAYVYLDGARDPLNPEGDFPRVTLSPGTHTFLAVNEAEGIRRTFRYDVAAADDNNTLVLNLATGQVEARRNRELDF